MCFFQLSNDLGFPVRPKKDLTFQKCLEMKLQDHIATIAKVAEVAGKEYSIEQVSHWRGDYITEKVSQIEFGICLIYWIRTVWLLWLNARFLTKQLWLKSVFWGGGSITDQTTYKLLLVKKVSSELIAQGFLLLKFQKCWKLIS